MEVNAESLKTIAANIYATGVNKIAIVSVMGAYRTGKSFLLDLFLRYLRFRTSRDGLSSVKCSEIDNLPSWLVKEGEIISEGRNESAGKIGFEWRGGMDKVTEGLWLWSTPYVLDMGGPDAGGPDSKVCVLLLDSQGAFDSKLTKDQSATIFGLTAILSSYQIYNVSKQIQEDTIENLHYFMECAGSCVRYLESEGGNIHDTALFQHLEFLVRDWANFESDWDVERCRQQMVEHLAHHVDHARDSTTATALKKMFSSISCWMLPHPGIKVNKPTWSGDIHDLDKEFIKFLDIYVGRVFSGDLSPKTILGKPLTASNFVDVVTTLTQSFTGLIPEGVNLATALARSTNLMTKELSVQRYRQSFDEVFDVKFKNGVSSDDFKKIQTQARSAAMELYTNGTRFGAVSEREAVQKELVVELARLEGHYADINRRRMESALNAFAGICLLVCVLYAIDKLSDITCDWYSQTCVKMSNALLLVYSVLVVGVLTNVYFLLQSKGRTVAIIAVIEMSKSTVALAIQLAGHIKKVANDIRDTDKEKVLIDIKDLWSRFAGEIILGLNELRSAVFNR